MDNLKRQKMIKRTERRDNAPENTMPAVLTTGCQTITSNLLDTTRPILLQESMMETGGALPSTSVVEGWLFLPLPEIKLARHKMN